MADFNRLGGATGVQSAGGVTESRPELTKEQVEDLVELGLFSMFNHKLAHAEQIFKGLQAVRPDECYVTIGLALMALTNGQNDEAISVLRKAMSDHPNNEDVQAILSLALLLSQRTEECREVTSRFLDKGDHELPEPLSLMRRIHFELENSTTPADSRWQGSGPNRIRSML